MHILIVKTSSLGDVIHTLPALSDANKHYPQLRYDWVVEEAYIEIPLLHPLVKQVIPVALRRWRKHPWQTRHTWHKFKHNLTAKRYDKIIDAQGLLKSAFLTNQARGIRCGLDYNSVREPLAALAYQQRYTIPKNQHAVTRIRQLFATVLEYPLPDSQPDYGIIEHFQHQSLSARPTVVFLHGTTWVTKHWPDNYWIKLAQLVTAAGFAVHLPWGNEAEYKRAMQIAAVHPNIVILPKSNLYGIATALARANAVVGVDTGLAHLAAALAIPSVTLYGATQPARTGTYGPCQKHLLANFPCAPCLRKKCNYRGLASISPACYEDLAVEKVWATLCSVMKL